MRRATSITNDDVLSCEPSGIGLRGVPGRICRISRLMRSVLRHSTGLGGDGTVERKYVGAALSGCKSDVLRGAGSDRAVDRADLGGRLAEIGGGA
jgi:hypothetical protein